MGFLPFDLVRVASGEKVVDNALLNRLGVQVARALAAQAAWDRRRVPLRGAASASAVRAIEEDGIVVLEDFLPRDRFAALRDEARAHLDAGEARIYKHGPNQLKQRQFANLASLPHVARFYDDARLHDLFDAGERLRVDFDDCMKAVEELSQGPGSEKDPETDLHVDIFFATHKAWLYLEDVTTDNAPFVYVKGSHRMDRHRLAREYADSVAGNRKSRRVLPEELAARGMSEIEVRAPANTLVVANTCGYHRRLRGNAGHARYGLHLSHRVNPFWPRALSPARLARTTPLRRLVAGA